MTEQIRAQACLKGHPVSLHILDFGLFRVHENARVIGISGFLIQTSADERILVDTGFPAKYADDPARATMEDHLDQFGEVLHCDRSNTPDAQLALAGVSLSDITLMVQTHTHIDHIGGLHLCPQVPILIAHAERALPRPLYWGSVQPLTWPERDYIRLEADTTLGPCFDILLVPGHAPGQLAMVIELPETGPVLLTSDAISRPSELVTGFSGSWDETLAAHHAARLDKIAKARNATVIYGHCPEQWKILKKAPLSYR